MGEREQELNLDGLVGPTHNFGGLSPGNLASAQNRDAVSNPRAAALQGLAKMRRVAALGVPQGVLPPPWRPHVPSLRRLGFTGSDDEVRRAAATSDPLLFRRMSSASAMWAANAATVAPSRDTTDGRVHLVPANLSTLVHRSIESDATTRALRAIFADRERFEVHEALPLQPSFSDEGAANHTRLTGVGGAVHLFAWGRTERGDVATPTRFPARQSLEASEAVARLLHLEPSRVLFPRQDPTGIDGGAFHTDVVLVGRGVLLLAHERAFVDFDAVRAQAEALLGEPLVVVMAHEGDLPLADAVATYPFNSQLLEVAPREFVVLAPSDVEEAPRVRDYLARVEREASVRVRIETIDVRQSMRNGGGPACLRLRVPLTASELGALGGRVRFDDALERDLTAWVERHYRDRLEPGDLADPALHREVQTALDDLSRLLRLGSVYEFQT